ncbi:MAG: dTDP-4-dehydrorhamnose reductase [Oscillospiraceae bacterium]|nr:dTDP-4-dehydrorhamnose reductase [Oscillospiraceae bacterium]
MKVLVTGVTGQLGFDVLKVLQTRKIECRGTGRKEFDLTDPESTWDYIIRYHPDAVIHCAAYTAVDQAEDEPELCRKVNAEGTRHIAQACKKIGAKMLYLSTDYVFPGTGENAYETNDPKGPQSVYGSTKLGGEEAVRELLKQHFIVRISWVFGQNGNNFVKTMLRLGKERSKMNIVCDQIGSPTYTADLAPLLCDMIVTEKYGTYHATNEGYCSWAEFASEIFRQAGYLTKVNFIPTSEYPSRAKRPFNSRMSKRSLDQAGFHRLPEWQDALKRFFEKIGV